MAAERLKKGDVLTAERTFTVDDVRAFTALSGDAGAHHLVPDAQGRLMVHGLLTASLPTSVGGRIHYIARRMDLTFGRPVFTGERIRAALTITDVVEEPSRLRLTMDVLCTNPDGKTVLSGQSDGVILVAGA